jgi:hypothetical protein
MIVDHGAHAKILVDKDGPRVRNAIHAFYKEYNLPYNQEWATQGQAAFKETTPSTQTLQSIRSKAQVNVFIRIIKMSGSVSGIR